MSKGSKPRPVKRQVFEDNYSNIFARKTWMDWAQEVGDVIYDPDGFDRKNPKKLYSRAEYLKGRPYCTMLHWNSEVK